MNYFDKSAIIINQICEKIEPGKKMLQKLMYLIERKGVTLELNYSIHYFGPYSSKLDNVMHTLESYDQLTIDTSGSTHIIRRGDAPIEGSLDYSDQEKVDCVLDCFLQKSAHELEALTTVDYVANTLLKRHGTDEEIIEKVQEIKGSKFSYTFLCNELTMLKQFEYI